MSNILNEVADRAKQMRQEQEKKEARWAEIQAGYEACDVLIEEALNYRDESVSDVPFTHLGKLDEARRMKAALEAIEREEFGERENHPMADRPYVASRRGPGSIEEATSSTDDAKNLDSVHSERKAPVEDTPEFEEALRRNLTFSNGRD